MITKNRKHKRISASSAGFRKVAESKYDIYKDLDWDNSGGTGGNKPKPKHRRTGHDWTAVQNRLNDLGFTDVNNNRLNPDGVWGDLTLSAWNKASKGGKPSDPSTALELLSSSSSQSATKELEAKLRLEEGGGEAQVEDKPLDKYLMYNGGTELPARAALFAPHKDYTLPLTALQTTNLLANANNKKAISEAYDKDNADSRLDFALANFTRPLDVEGEGEGQTDSSPLAWNGQDLIAPNDIRIKLTADSREVHTDTVAMIEIDGSQVPYFSIPEGFKLNGKDIGGYFAPLTLRDNMPGDRKGPNYLTDKEQWDLVSASDDNVEGPKTRWWGSGEGARKRKATRRAIKRQRKAERKQK
jgi:hypothetical protein